MYWGNCLTLIARADHKRLTFYALVYRKQCQGKENSIAVIGRQNTVTGYKITTHNISILELVPTKYTLNTIQLLRWYLSPVQILIKILSDRIIFVFSWYREAFPKFNGLLHLQILYNNDVIMGAVMYQITSFTIVYSTIDSNADQRKHQSSASLAFVRGIHRGPVNSPHKWPVTRKMFAFDDVIMFKPNGLACTTRPNA